MEQPIPQIPPGADEVVVSVNPKAGARSPQARVQRMAAALAARGLRCTVLEDLAAACELANARHRAGALRALVGVGGDGTAAELANRTAPGVPFTLLPAGTSNLLARQLRLPVDPEALAAVIAAGRAVRLDAGQAGRRLFLIMVSCGFDAEVVQRLHQRRQLLPSGHISYWTYLKPIWESIRSYKYPMLRIECDGPAPGSPPPEVIKARWAFALNLPRYGWGLPLAPRAVGDDGLLDLCTFARGSLASSLGYALATHLHLHQRLPSCRMRRVGRLRITSDRPVQYQLDGDPGGWLPLEVEVLRGRCTMLVP